MRIPTSMTNHPRPEPCGQRRRLLAALAAMPLAGAAAALPRAARAASQGGVIEGRDRWLFPAWESYVADDTAACASVADLIGKAAAQLAARQIHCTIVIAPLKARACADKLAAGQAVSAAVQKRDAAIRARAAQAGVDIVDSDAALAQARTNEDDLYIRADYHWSAHTAEAFALATAERLARVPLGPGGEAPTLGPWTEEVHYGDLAELLPPERKRAIGKDRFIVRQAAGDGALVGDDRPAVQVVGNSMVQPYLGFPQRLSNQLERPVGLTWTFGNTGPWKTLVDYLESAAFGNARPRAIVWQFNEGQMAYGPGASGQWDATSIMPDDAWLTRIAKALG
ncbi:MULTISPECIES: alginate O-acetyltransferase AlgX-related protein [Burkholderia]|uniref:alginate O-acetyltransferase AlgX-related protein n=1 Tax=Burkholderia TaxID=32008 RepID=UPI0009F292FD|nr:MULTISPECIES: hypothetical protein [unclassified Burkholderia]